MKKKIFTAIIATTMVFTLAACGTNKTTESNSSEVKTTETTKATEWSTLKGDDRKVTKELKSIFTKAVKDTDYEKCEPKELDAKQTIDTATNYRFICDDDVKVVVHVDNDKYTVLKSQSTKITKETESTSKDDSKKKDTTSKETTKNDKDTTSNSSTTKKDNTASSDSSKKNNTTSTNSGSNKKNNTASNNSSSNNNTTTNSSSNNNTSTNNSGSSTTTENTLAPTPEQTPTPEPQCSHDYQPIGDHTNCYFNYHISCGCGNYAYTVNALYGDETTILAQLDAHQAECGAASYSDYSEETTHYGGYKCSKCGQTK